MNKEEYDYIYGEHFKIINNSNIKNKPLMILFSGIPSSGKTYIAKKLEKRYNGVRVSEDDVRILLSKIEKKMHLSDKFPFRKTIKDYLSLFFKNYNLRNNLIIWDRAVDRKYKQIFRVARMLKLKIFLIRLNISKKTFLIRIKSREKSKSRIWIERYDKWKDDFDKSKKIINSNFNLNTDKRPSLNLLYKKLDKLLKY